MRLRKARYGREQQRRPKLEADERKREATRTEQEAEAEGRWRVGEAAT